MTLRWTLPALLLFLTTTLLAAAEWTSLAPNNLSEWSDPGEWWVVENGVFVAESKGGADLPKIHHLQWRGSTGPDVEFSLEYRITAKEPQDAGFYFRVERTLTEDPSSITGYQAELDTGIMYGNQGWVRQGKFFGHIHDAKRRHMFKRSLISTAREDGRIVARPLPNAFVPSKVFRRAPDWNHCRIEARGNLVKLFLNGVLANEIHDHDPRKRSTGNGIALQFRPNREYRFEVRNLKFRALGAPPATAEPAARPVAAEAVVDLLPARDLSQFEVSTGRRPMRGDPNGVFKLENDELVVSGKEPGMLATRRSFTNYHFTVNYRWDTSDPGRDSGVFVNTIGSVGKRVALECNLLGPDRGVSGELFLFGKGRKQLQVGELLKKQGAIKPSKSFEHAVGQWNTMEVSNDDGHFRLALNGQETVVGRIPMPRSGTIMLQSNRGAIRFRSARVIDYDSLFANFITQALSGNLSGAAEGFERMFEQHPKSYNSIRPLWLATLYAGEGNREAHEKLCREFFRKFANPKHPAEGSRPAKAYVLLPGADDPQLLAQALKASRHSTTAVRNNAWYNLTRAMIEYRMGNHPQMSGWLQASLRSKHGIQRTPALAFAAMADFQLGNRNRARRSLSQAEAAFEKLESSHSNWNDLIGAKLALDEAKALIK